MPFIRCHLFQSKSYKLANKKINVSATDCDAFVILLHFDCYLIVHWANEAGKDGGNCTSTTSWILIKCRHKHRHKTLLWISWLEVFRSLYADLLFEACRRFLGNIVARTLQIRRDINLFIAKSWRKFVPASHYSFICCVACYVEHDLNIIGNGYCS